MPLAIQKRGGIRSNNTTIRIDEKGNTVCTLHATDIATFQPKLDHVVLFVGRWNTPTTLRRMNECLHAWGFEHRVCKSDFATSNALIMTRAGLVK